MYMERDGKVYDLTPDELAAAAAEHAWEEAAAMVMPKLSWHFTYLPHEASEAAIQKYIEQLDAAKKDAESNAIKVAMEAAKVAVAEVSRTAGGYICVEAYAAVDEEELDDEEETPTCTLCVKEDWLAEFIKPEWTSVADYVSSYTFDANEGMEQAAIEAGALAFVYCEKFEGKCKFYGQQNPNAMIAFWDYLSGLLDGAGYEDAGKWFAERMGV